MPIIDHIEYVNPNRRYLPSDITIRFMHSDYKYKHPANDKCGYEPYRKAVSDIFRPNHFVVLYHDRKQTQHHIDLSSTPGASGPQPAASGLQPAASSPTPPPAGCIGLPRQCNAGVGNLKSDTKLTKDLSLSRIISPYAEPPTNPQFRVSPLGVVPKKTPGEFRMIHHLSYPEGSSVNDFIPQGAIIYAV